VEIVRFGEFVLDLRSGELSRNGSRIVLPYQPFCLLRLLIREQGTLVSRETLRHELWPDGTFVDFDASLNAAVKRLREALGDSAATPRFIETIPRRGYRFVASVNAETAGDALPLEAQARPRRESRGAYVLMGVIVAIVAALGIGLRVSPGPPQAGDLVIERLTNIGAVTVAAVSPNGQDVAYVRADGLRQSLWLLNRDEREARRLVAPLDGVFRTLTFAPNGVVFFTLFHGDRALVQPYRVPTTGGPLTPISEAVDGASFSPGGERRAYVSTFSLALRESRIVVSDASGGALQVLALRKPPHSFVRTKPAWSPDGSRLAVVGVTEASSASPELVVLDAVSGRLVQTMAMDLAVVSGVLWPREDTLVVSGRRRRGHPQRLWLISLPGGATRPLTADVSDYVLAGLAADSGQVVAIRGEAARSIWTARIGTSGAARQVAVDSGDLGGLEGLAWADGRRLLYTATATANVDIWSVDLEDGTRRRLTTDPAEDFHPTASDDGRTVAFASNRSGALGIWTMAGDGSNQRALTNEGDSRPSISRDGQFVVFQRGTVDTTPFTLWWRSLSGGETFHINAGHSMRPAVSPNGAAVAHYQMTSEAWVLLVSAIASGRPLHTLPISATHTERVVRWAPDGRSLAYIEHRDGASNVWVKPLTDSPARLLTSFTEGRIASFDWSADGQLAWLRVNEVRDIVTVRLR
jgi:Tol biopolymer transport system component/DNA-binding winged helix-turn-helix (wHTH) protein